MRLLKKYRLILFIILGVLVFETFYSCANARWGTDAGLNVTWGPNGPRVRPHIDFDIYNGGRLRH